MDLSIIIPVYNTSISELKRCFTSICPLSEIKFEVIVVDDGSLEETASFCQDYAARYPRFHYLRQENRGVSAARNEGLKKSSGRYVMFMDADDELIASRLRKMHVNGNWDIIFFDFELLESGRTRICTAFDEKQVTCLPKKQLISIAYQNKLNSAWSKLYLRSFLSANDLLFDIDMIYAEDAKFVLKSIFAAKNILYVDTAVYRYIHSFKNGDRRLSKFPFKVIENSIRLFSIRNSYLERYGIENGFSEHEIKDLRVLACERVVGDLFESMGSLQIMGISEKRIRELIVPLLDGELKEYSRFFGFIAKIKYLLLKDNCVLLLKISAYLREIYIRIRR